VIVITNYEKYNLPGEGSLYLADLEIDGISYPKYQIPAEIAETDGAWDEGKTLAYLNADYARIKRMAKDEFLLTHEQPGFGQLKVLYTEAPSVTCYLEYDPASGDIQQIYFELSQVPPDAEYTVKAMSIENAGRIYDNPGGFYIDVESADKDLYEYAT
jgi:hypothetical protein